MDLRVQDNLNGMQHDYIAPFLWLHDEEDGLILRELQKIYDSGIRSVCLESRTHEGFCGENWWSDMRLIMEECRKKDMKVWILDDKTYPSGYANGIFKDKYKDLRFWGIAQCYVDVSGPIVEGSVMADHWKYSAEDEIIGVVACKHVPNEETYTEIIDITEGLHDGMVYFSLPEGMWRIVVMLKTRHGIKEWALNYCDKLNPEATRLYLEEVHEAHYRQLKEYFGNTFLGFYADEPCFENEAAFHQLGQSNGHYPWADKLLDILAKEFGADARKMLAGIWFDIEQVSDKIRYAYMDVITREYQHNYCKQISEWCRDHGVQYIGHVIEDNNIHAMVGNGAGHFFRAQDEQDMSGIDLVMHQIVPGLTECSGKLFAFFDQVNNNFFHYYLAKMASSMAHIDPRKRGRSMCEIFGAYGWSEGTKTMKYLADHMLVRGINYYVPHAFSPKYDDPDCPPNFYDSGENALYKYFGYLMGYMNRMSYLLNDGVHVPTVAILYDAEAHWVGRNRVPLEDVAKELYDNLLDYDIIPADVLGQINGDGMLNGEKYPCLVVPCYEAMPEQVLQKLKNISLRTIFVTKPGVKVPDGLGENVEIVELSGLAEYMRAKVGADVTADYQGIYLRYYHYTRNGAHMYMFSNEDIHHTIKTEVTISAFGGGKYMIYDAMENKAFAGSSDSGRIEIELPPYHSVMIICGEVSYEGIPCLRKVEIVEEKVLEPEFRISYAAENEGEYTYYKTTKELFNITGYRELPRFSGNIKYEWEFQWEGDGEVRLDLGRLAEAAQVYVNDVCVGAKQIPPYEFDVTDVIREGSNTCTVIVSNHNGYRKRDWLSAYALFEASGLLGPVMLKKIK